MLEHRIEAESTLDKISEISDKKILIFIILLGIISFKIPKCLRSFPQGPTFSLINKLHIAFERSSSIPRRSNFEENKKKWGLSWHLVHYRYQRRSYLFTLYNPKFQNLISKLNPPSIKIRKQSSEHFLR